MKSPVGPGTTFGFVLAALVLISSGWLSSQNLNRISRNEAWVSHTHEVMDALSDILSGVAQAESAQRTYLLTGDPSFTDFSRKVGQSTANNVEMLQHLVSDNPGQIPRAASLKEMVINRLSLFENGIKARDQGGLEAASQLVMAGRGSRATGAIRGLIGEMRATEQRLLVEREQQTRSSYRVASISMWITSLVGFFLVAFAFLKSAREVATRARSVEALARVNNELEARVEARTSELAASNESLTRSNRELEQFASVASHDLQEPLRKIQAFGDRLQTKSAAQLGEQGLDYLARMQASASRMRSLIDALLTFSRVTTKAQPFVPVNLAVTAEEVVSDLEGRLLTSDGRVEVGSLPTLEADPLQMRQLLQNLVSNALKFARKHEPPVVRVDSKMLNGNDGEVARCEISVSDNGIGFEETYVDRIFELFQRLHARQEYEGTGLGLAICRKIVERHGGSITASSIPGTGSTFRVVLPVEQEKKE